jgi:hypothetical protein
LGNPRGGLRREEKRKSNKDIGRFGAEYNENADNGAL